MLTLVKGTPLLVSNKRVKVHHLKVGKRLSRMIEASVGIRLSGVIFKNHIELFGGFFCFLLFVFCVFPP